ncbi:MAG: response regulator [Acidobacterium ailaaui]|nr:response regulator [Pseudacidobacterium ailaaui]
MKVLIVDDSSFIRSFLCALLEAHSLQCVNAENGKMALDALAASGPFDLALVDVNMPVMNGLELVKVLRRLPEYSAMKIVMVTTEADHAYIEAALAAGANEYLMKPFDEESLFEKIHMVGLARA